MNIAYSARLSTGAIFKFVLRNTTTSRMVIGNVATGCVGEIGPLAKLGVSGRDNHKLPEGIGGV
jgi:hypothetical protein